MNEEDKIVYQRLIYYNDEEHLAKRIIELQHCCKNLQSKIDKAIEYVNTWLVDEYSICVPDKEEPDVFCEYEPNAIDKLLDILKEDK